MLEDLKKLETLDYKPPGAIEKPANVQPAPMGFNSVVIKPETRVNKAEDVDQPNQNLMIIEEIEGLFSQVNDKLESLNVPTVTDSTINEELRLKSQALEEIDLFQKTTLFDLRKAFE